MNAPQARELLAPQWAALKLTLGQIKRLPAEKAKALQLLLDSLAPAAAEFIATGDERHLEIIKFRLETFGRDANFDALKLSDKAIYASITGLLRSVAALATLL